MSAIVVRGLTKKFRRNSVLKDFNLEVNDGEFFALLGLEGSGKTTLARTIFHFLKPNQGSIMVFDMDAVKESEAIKGFCGYVPQDVWMYDHLKPMAIFKNTVGFHDSKNLDDADYLMDLFGLSNRKKFGDMDDEERKLVAIINALITKPKLLILDEPSKDLSPSMVEKVFKHLRTLQREEGLSALILTDSLSVGQRYADRVGYLRDGAIVDMEYIKEKDSNDKLLKIFEEEVYPEAFESIGAKLLRSEPSEYEFFYDGYLPTLTTVLYQERIKNYTLEDAALEKKIESYSYTGPANYAKPASGEDLKKSEDVTEPTVVVKEEKEEDTVVVVPIVEEKSADTAPIQPVDGTENIVSAQPTEDKMEENPEVLTVKSEEETPYTSEKVDEKKEETVKIEPVDSYAMSAKPVEKMETSTETVPEEVETVENDKTITMEPIQKETKKSSGSWLGDSGQKNKEVEGRE